MGSGKCAKVQCDFCALISPLHFREFVKPSLEKQCSLLDSSLYHLDGPDEIKHLDALMEIEDLKALQFTPGAGNPDGGSLLWYPIYDKVKAAGKSIWVNISDGSFSDWVQSADRLINTYGSESMYIIFPVMSIPESDNLISHAAKYWGSKF